MIHTEPLRSAQIDNLKGLAIILVVFGHAIQNSTPSFDQNIIFNYIYSFHMPLFMFLSGYVLYGKNISLKNKFKSLVIPFISWYMLTYAINLLRGFQVDGFPQHMIKLLKYPDNGLWFLLALFLNISYLKLVQFFIDIRTKKYVDAFSLLAAYILIQYVPTNYLGIGFVKWHFFFFSLGFLTPKYGKEILQNIYFKTSAIVGFIFLGYYWRRIGIPIDWNYVSSFLNNQHLSFFEPYLSRIYYMLVPTLGIYASLAIVPDRINNYILSILNYLGHKSLEIYVVHTNFIYAFGTKTIQIFLAAFLSVLLSLATASGLKRVRIINRMLYGLK